MLLPLDEHISSRLYDFVAVSWFSLLFFLGLLLTGNLSQYSLEWHLLSLFFYGLLLVLEVFFTVVIKLLFLDLHLVKIDIKMFFLLNFVKVVKKAIYLVSFLLLFVILLNEGFDFVLLLPDEFMHLRVELNG